MLIFKAGAVLAFFMPTCIAAALTVDELSNKDDE